MAKPHETFLLHWDVWAWPSSTQKMNMKGTYINDTNAHKTLVETWCDFERITNIGWIVKVHESCGHAQNRMHDVLCFVCGLHQCILINVSDWPQSQSGTLIVYTKVIVLTCNEPKRINGELAQGLNCFALAGFLARGCAHVRKFAPDLRQHSFIPNAVACMNFAVEG